MNDYYYFHFQIVFQSPRVRSSVLNLRKSFVEHRYRIHIDTEKRPNAAHGQAREKERVKERERERK